MPPNDTTDYSTATEIEVLGVVDELLTMFMEKENCVEQSRILLSVAEIALQRLSGEELPSFSEDPESVSGYLLIRQMVRKGLFDTLTARAFAGLVKELDEKARNTEAGEERTLKVVV